MDAQRRATAPIPLSILLFMCVTAIGPAQAIDKIKSGDWHERALWDPQFVPSVTEGAAKKVSDLNGTYLTLSA